MRAVLRRLQAWAGAPVRRIRAHAPSLALAATAAGTAYLVASLAVGPPSAVFAPVAAVVAIGLSAGQRVRRAAEISTGVVLGILAADLLTRGFGVGPMQLAIAVLLAMGAAVAVRPSQLMANQAAVAAVVVVALVPYLDAGPWVRLSDALIGGVTAVVFNAVLSPDPLRGARVVTVQVLGEYAALLDRLAWAVRDGALPDAEDVLADVAVLDGAQAEIGDALAATRERLVIGRSGRERRRATLDGVEGVMGRVVILMATGRGLCRATANLVRHGPATGPAAQEVRAGLASALDELVAAVQGLQGWLDGENDTDAVRQHALQAAVRASGLRPRTQASSMLVGQIRSATVDVLRITGQSQAKAVQDLEDAAGRAEELGA